MLDDNLQRYIWKYTRHQQFWILGVVAVSMIPFYMSFNLPKQIVNGPIQGKGFETAGARQTFFDLAIPIPGYGDLTMSPGIDLTRTETLFALSGVFLALVVVNGWFKYYINTYKGKLGERLLRRMRFTLVDQILRFPPAAFKRLKGAEISSMVKDEVEPIGGFTGDAFVAPALLGGQALTALIFIFVQSVPLGLITAALVAVQAFIIPRMRRRLLVLGRERQLTARELAGRVSEIFEGINTIHAFDTTNYERADISARLGHIFRVRFDIYQWKFLVKFINNFLASVTPFLFYAVGGYLALHGQINIGQLVAVIGAYKDLPGPLKELIDWDQNRQDVQVKYATVTQQFAVDNLIDETIHTVSVEDSEGLLAGPLATSNLGVIDDGGSTSLERVDFALEPGETVAVVGNAGAGGDVLAEALGRIVWPTTGRITAGGTDLSALPESVTGRAITYVGPETYFFFGSVRDNLLYGLKNAPITARAHDLDAADDAAWAWARHEAALAGNPDLDLASDWISYPSLGLKDRAALVALVNRVLTTVGLRRDTLDLALRSTVDPQDYPGIAEKIVDMRQTLLETLEEQGLADLIVPFEPGTYNVEATVIENLLFGNPSTPELMFGAIGENAYFRKVMRGSGLVEKLFAMGVEIARNAVELFADLPADHPFFQQLTFMSADDIPSVQALLTRLENAPGSRTSEDMVRMIRIGFDYVEPRFRFGLLTDELMEEIVSFRQTFYEGLPPDLQDGIERYDPTHYLASSSLLDNMLFGRISQKYRDGADRIYTIVTELLEPMGLSETAMAVGLDFHVGAGGKRLTAVQRQKLSLARALIRRSTYYIFNRPLSALDGRAQDKITQAALDHLHADGRTPGILWVVSNPAMTQLFDRIVVFDRGQLVEEGTHDALVEKNGIFKGMLSA